MKKGFTLLEVLVASLLMGMLVTILTMVFNSSSIAWRTGKASLAELGGVRRQVAVAGQLADDALPFVCETAGSTEFGLAAGAWNFKTGTLRKRALVTTSGGDGTDAERARVKWLQDQSRVKAALAAQSAGSLYPWRAVQGSSGSSRSVSAYTVGVLSYGPDGKPDTPDDINTWPEDVQ